MTAKDLTEKAMCNLLDAQEALRVAVEHFEAGSTGQLEAVQRAQVFMGAASNKLVVLEWERTHAGARA